MRLMWIAAIVVAALLAGPRQSSAQELRGFVTLVISSNVNDEHDPGIGAGVVLDLAKGWVSVANRGTECIRTEPGARRVRSTHGDGGIIGAALVGGVCGGLSCGLAPTYTIQYENYCDYH